MISSGEGHFHGLGNRNKQVIKSNVECKVLLNCLMLFPTNAISKNSVQFRYTLFCTLFVSVTNDLRMPISTSLRRGILFLLLLSHLIINLNLQIDLSSY